MPQLVTMTSSSGADRNFKWPYQANVIKTFAMVSSTSGNHRDCAHCVISDRDLNRKMALLSVFFRASGQTIVFEPIILERFDYLDEQIRAPGLDQVTVGAKFRCSLNICRL